MPSQRVSGPVVCIDYDLLGGLPAKAQFDWKRLERLHARFSEEPADRDLFDRTTHHEVNA